MGQLGLISWRGQNSYTPSYFAHTVCHISKLIYIFRVLMENLCWGTSGLKYSPSPFTSRNTKTISYLKKDIIYIS